MNTDVIKLLIVIIQFLISYQYGLLHLLIVLLIVVLLYKVINNIVNVLKDLFDSRENYTSSSRNQTKPSAPSSYEFSSREQKEPPYYTFNSRENHLFSSREQKEPPSYTFDLRDPPSYNSLQKEPPPYEESISRKHKEPFKLLMRKDSHLKTSFYASPLQPTIQRPPTLFQTIMRFPTNLFNMLRGEPRQY